MVICLLLTFHLTTIIYYIATMSQMCAITFTLFLLFEHGFGENQSCVERQSLQLARKGIIPCSFEDAYFGLYWYDTSDLLQQPILFDEEGEKGGAGYTSGEYDLALGGSLLINNVTSHHERTFVVVLLREVTSKYIGHEVVVTVIAYPSVRYPVIDRCMDKQHCYTVMSDNDTISCNVRRTRPSVHLTWMKKTSTSELDITKDRSYSPTGDLNTTTATMTFQRKPQTSFYLFTCESENTNLLRDLTSFVIAEVIEDDVEINNVISINSQINKTFNLPCHGFTSLFVIWKRTENKTHYQIIGYEYNEVKHSVDPYILHKNGTLTIYLFNKEKEGVYVCIASNGTREVIVAYEVIYDNTTTTTDQPVPGSQNERFKILLVVLVPVVLVLLVIVVITVLKVSRRKPSSSSNQDSQEPQPQEYKSAEERIESSPEEQMQLIPPEEASKDGRDDKISMQIKRFLVGRNAINCEEKVVVVLDGRKSDSKKFEIDWHIFEYWSGGSSEHESVQCDEIERNIMIYYFKFKKNVATADAKNFTFIVANIAESDDDDKMTPIKFKEITEQLIYISTRCSKYKLKHIHAVVVVKRFATVPLEPSKRDSFFPILRLFGNDVSDKVYIMLASKSSEEYKSLKHSKEATERCENNEVLKAITKQQAISFERSITVLEKRKVLTEKVATVNQSILKLLNSENELKKEKQCIQKMRENDEYSKKERDEKIHQQEKIVEVVQKDFELQFENVQNDINPVKDILLQINEISLMSSHLTLGGSSNDTHIMESVHKETSFEEVCKELMCKSGSTNEF